MELAQPPSGTLSVAPPAVRAAWALWWGRVGGLRWRWGVDLGIAPGVVHPGHRIAGRGGARTVGRDRADRQGAAEDQRADDGPFPLGHLFSSSSSSSMVAGSAAGSAGVTGAAGGAAPSINPSWNRFWTPRRSITPR